MVLVHAGLTSLIAHIRVGRMQVALEAKSTVLPAVGKLCVYVSVLPAQLLKQIGSYDKGSSMLYLV